MSLSPPDGMSPVAAAALNEMIARAQAPDVADEEVVPRKASLGDLLLQAREADDGVLDHELDLEELGADLRNKVDGITEYLDYCRARQAAIGKRADELAAKARAFKNRADRLEQYVAEKMAEDRAERIARGEKHDGPTYRLPGVAYEFRMQFSERVTPKREPDPSLYLKLKPFIKRTYEWDRTALKKALKANDAAVTPFADITRHPNLQIKPKA